PVCIVLAARTLSKDETKPARVRFHVLPKGRREGKFKALAALSLDAKDWIDCPTEWRTAFLPQVGGTWADFEPLRDQFDYNGSGVMPGRTWIIAPDRETLEKRWDRLIKEKGAENKELLFHPHLRAGKQGDKHLTKAVKAGLAGHEFRGFSVASDQGKAIAPTRYAFRTLDRQWIIPDARLINQPNPALWKGWSDKQVFVTAPEDRAITSGPAVTFSALIPDLHHYHGRGGRVYPLWADAQATQSNLRADTLHKLAATLGAAVGPGDFFAYIAAVMAHPAFTARFRNDLVRPGLRVPLTADKTLFDEAVALGCEIVWLHCYGERFVDAAAGRPKGPPRLPKNERPIIPADGAIPPAPEPLPETMDYDAAKRRLVIGKGFIENVAPAMRNYEISGKNVLDQWFSYRRRDRTKPLIGDKRPPSPLEK
ncbi:MAG: type ISP restriction/modification enzyme, partial [Methylocella sp.]